MTTHTPKQPISTTQRSARSLLIEWANQQDQWIRSLIDEVLQTRTDIPEVRLDSLYDLLLREKGLAEGDTVTPAPVQESSGPSDTDQNLVLATLSDVQNVNALAQRQTIAFNPRVTLLFGENATGKTGYVRILKRVASVRTAEPILPNISTVGTQGSPTATIGYSIDDQQQELKWHNETGVYPLTAIDVFDSRGAIVHLDQELTYVYTPGDLDLFRIVNESIEKIRVRLDNAKTQSLPSGNAFLPKFSRESRIYPFIDSLGASTDMTQLEALAVVTPEEEAGLESLRQRVDALKSSAADANLQVARSSHEFYESLRTAISTASQLDTERYNKLIEALQTAQRQHEQATREAFSGDPIPGVLGDAWKAFIHAGEEYLEETGATAYPSKSEPCIYCRQPLGEAAVELVRKYRDFCTNKHREAVNAARRNVQNATADFRRTDFASHVQGVQKRLALLDGADKQRTVLGEARTCLQAAAEMQAGINEERPLDRPLDKATCQRLLNEIGGSIQQLSTTIAQLSEKSEQRKSALAEQSTKLRDLEARLTLRALLPDIRAMVQRAKWADRANTCLSRFRQILRSLTEVSKIASEDLLNENFERLFQEECRHLRAPQISLDFSGRRGQTARRKSLSSPHKLTEVLSEGEQKVIALADFIAEARLRPKSTPIVFDDPVNSLDYKRLTHMVDRLVELSRARQVIVFTHNIWFATELLSRFEDAKDDCSFFTISEDNEARGIVTRGTHPRADTYKYLRGRINTVIQDAQRAQGETLEALVERGYELMRNICEVIVEAELLQGVVQRYQPNVMMTRLPAIRHDRLSAAIGTIMPLYEKCCRCIASHSQPLETLNVRPSLAELQTDWNTLQQARDGYIN